jgi:hypothetical protein
MDHLIQMSSEVELFEFPVKSKAKRAVGRPKKQQNNQNQENQDLSSRFIFFYFYFLCFIFYFFIFYYFIFFIFILLFYFLLFFSIENILFGGFVLILRLNSFVFFFEITFQKNFSFINSKVLLTSSHNMK